MKLEMNSKNALVVAIVVIAALAIAFWMLALSPKREEAEKLDTQAKALEASLAQHRSEAAQGAEARKEFAVDYQQLVVLGKAVPADDETASLLVQVNRIANRSEVKFREIALEPAEGETEPAASPTPESGAALVSPTEVAASTMPLGAAIGPAGLAVMPYTLTFDGDFFKVADFIKGVDALVKTENEKVAVSGRLITLNGFALAAPPDGQFPQLQATFSITTYLTPPGQGLTAGATPTSPSPTAAATPASTTTGGTP